MTSRDRTVRLPADGITMYGAHYHNELGLQVPHPCETPYIGVFGIISFLRNDVAAMRPSAQSSFPINTVGRRRFSTLAAWTLTRTTGELRLPYYRNAGRGVDLGVDRSVGTLLVADAHNALRRRQSAFRPVKGLRRDCTKSRRSRTRGQTTCGGRGAPAALPRPLPRRTPLRRSQAST